MEIPFLWTPLCKTWLCWIFQVMLKNYSTTTIFNSPHCLQKYQNRTYTKFAFRLWHLIGMTRVCRNVTNQVTLELVVEAMCLGYNYKKMHILTEKLWTCPSAGFSPHYFSCYFRLCTDGKKKNHTKHSKDENKLSMLNEHLFAVAAAAMAEAVSEAEVWLKLPISVPAARTVAEAVPEHQTPSAAQWAEELPEASWVTVEPVSGSNSRKENELWRRLNQKQSVKDKLGNPPTWFGSVWILCAFHLNGILGL